MHGHVPAVWTFPFAQTMPTAVARGSRGAHTSRLSSHPSGSTAVSTRGPAEGVKSRYFPTASLFDLGELLCLAMRVPSPPPACGEQRRLLAASQEQGGDATASPLGWARVPKEGSTNPRPLSSRVICENTFSAAFLQFASLLGRPLTASLPGPRAREGSEMKEGVAAHSRCRTRQNEMAR